MHHYWKFPWQDDHMDICGYVETCLVSQWLWKNPVWCGALKRYTGPSSPGHYHCHCPLELPSPSTFTYIYLSPWHDSLAKFEFSSIGGWIGRGKVFVVMEILTPSAWFHWDTVLVSMHCFSGYYRQDSWCRSFYQKSLTASY